MTLDACEMFDSVKNEWFEMQPLVEGRCSAGACSLDNGRFLYVFGGYQYDKEARSLRMLQSIERYNTELDIWLKLDLVTPVRIANPICCSLNDRSIILLGGSCLPASSGSDEKPLTSTSVLMLAGLVNMKDSRWLESPQHLPVHSSLLSAVHNGHGVLSMLAQKDRKAVPYRLDIDLKKAFASENSHWKDLLEREKKLRQDCNPFIFEFDKPANQKQHMHLIDEMDSE